MSTVRAVACVVPKVAAAGEDEMHCSRTERPVQPGRRLAWWCSSADPHSSSAR